MMHNIDVEIRDLPLQDGTNPQWKDLTDRLDRIEKKFDDRLDGIEGQLKIISINLFKKEEDNATRE